MPAVYNAGQFILALLSQCHPLVSGCFGCSGTLKPFGRIPTELQDLVLATEMKRPFIHEGEKRERMGKVYFHASVQCVQRKHAYLDPRNILIPPALIMNLTKSHKIRNFTYCYKGLIDNDPNEVM
jgi:hypothetical protein